MLYKKHCKTSLVIMIGPCHPKVPQWNNNRVLASLVDEPHGRHFPALEKLQHPTSLLLKARFVGAHLPVGKDGHFLN